MYMMKKVPYDLVVGSLMYAMVCTRLDIAQIVGVLSQYIGDPGMEHQQASKWVLHYLKGTSDIEHQFGWGNLTLKGFIDVNLRVDVNIMQSKIRYDFTLGGGAVSWLSHR